jgi:polysaccharide export outer membrane protein
MDGQSPEENIEVLANDVITVPKADLVYVVGAVRRSGGFPLSEKEQVTVLQAVSLAEGLERVAGAKNARILRQAAPGVERTEIPVNVQQILDGRAKDVSLQANDILFIPNNVAKSASLRALEAAIQTGTGLVIWGRY